MIFSDFGKALGQLDDGRFLRVVALGVGLALGLLISLTVLLHLLVGWWVPESFGFFGWEFTWIDNVASWAAVVLMMGLSVFLMIPVASAFTGLFLDDIAQAVEDRHYDLPPVPKLGWSEAIGDSLGFLALIVVVNLFALILYLFSGPFAPLVFWGVNGFLLGREYFQMVAMRRLGRAGAKAARRKHFGAIWFAGTLMAIPLTVPVLNLIIPVLGVATFTHLFHRLSGTGGRRPDQSGGIDPSHPLSPIR